MGGAVCGEPKASRAAAAETFHLGDAFGRGISRTIFSRRMRRLRRTRPGGWPVWKKERAAARHGGRA